MTSRLVAIAGPLLVAAASSSATSAAWPAPALAEDWSAWRGPRGDGTSLEVGVPTRWDAPSGEGLLWKADLQGRGHGSPIVRGDRIFLVTCDEATGERLLLAVRSADGSVAWKEAVFQGPLETKHGLNSHASSTPAADGERVFVAFLEVDGRTVTATNVSAPRDVTLGKILVAAYTLDGKRHWLERVGDFVSVHGFCSNPVLFEDRVIINGDHDGDAYLVALDRATGAVRWRIPRENKTRSYVTPILREIGGRTQMILSGSKCVASYDPRTGQRLWIVDGPTEQFVASPVFDGERVFITGGFPDYHILAIRPDGEGNVTDTHIAWRTTRGAAYVPSPVLCDGKLIVVSDKGIGSCFDAKTGERFWMERLSGAQSASLVTAQGLVYVLSDEGQTTVLRPGPALDVVSRNDLGERAFASPAISGGVVYVRGERHLFALGQRPGAGAAK